MNENYYMGFETKTAIKSEEDFDNEESLVAYFSASGVTAKVLFGQNEEGVSCPEKDNGFFLLSFPPGKWYDNNEVRNHIRLS